MSKPSCIVPAIFIAFVFSACTPQAAMTGTPIPPKPELATIEMVAATISPKKTSTPVPTLVAHEWSQIEPLIVLGGEGGDGGCGFEGLLPDFTILPDGRLYEINWNKDIETYEIKTTTLSRQTTCNLLNSIDQAGFFDYDPSTYISDPQNWNPPVMGAGTNTISVHAWRSNSVNLYGLGWFINNSDEIKKAWEPDCGVCPNLKFPTILPAIRKTAQLLWSYKPADLKVYQSGRLGVWFDGYLLTDDPVDWPLKSIRLSTIVPTKEPYLGDSPNLILTGTDANTVYKLFDERINVCGITVRQGGKLYRAFARLLLPNEYLPTDPPMTSLSCSPSDGWVEMP